MAIAYNIYANDGSGGEVNYGTPIASTSTLTHVVPKLAAPSDNTFAVRAFDVISGIEEANTDARIQIVINAAGLDVTSRPNAVIGLSVRPAAGGACWVAWGYDSTGQGGAPSAFQVSLTAGTSVPLANPVASITYLPSVPGYGCTLSGLVGKSPYTIAVQAVGASSELVGLIAIVSIIYPDANLSGVDSLVATPTA